MYVFDAALNPIKNSTGGKKFTGGISYGTDDIGRVEVSNDGRVFLSRLNTTGSPILEVNPANLNDNFKNVFTSITGSAIGIDVKGAGDNLQLVMLSKTSRTITEYDLKTATQWTSSTPSRTYIKTDKTTGKALSLVTDNAYISYDLTDGVWLTQHRATATTTEPTIAHVIPSGMDYNNYNASLSHNGTSNGGIAISPDGKLLAVVGAGTTKLTIYSVSREGGNITLKSKYTLTGLGNNHTALEWDYAGNLYVANRSSEKVTFYAMPYSGTVETPCASKYAFELEEIVANVYTLTTNVVGEGTIEGNEGSYIEGTTATLTASPADHYDFVNWTGDVTSTDNPLTITVNSDMTITANFQEHTKYTITAHAADNTMGYVTGGKAYYAGETVTLKAIAKTGYYFTGWSDGNTDNPHTFTATEDVTLQANFAAAYPRVYAYGLDVVDNGDSYTFSFKPNTDAVSGNLLLYSEDGTSIIQTHPITTSISAHTVTTITINKTELPNPADIPWAIQLRGNAIPAFAETFADADYRFAKGHAAVDNSPESEYFGRVYVADRRSTKKNSGVYVYNADLTPLNTEAYKLELSTAGYSRPAVGADGTVYLTGYTDAESGIFVVDPADLTTCTQFYNGTRASSGLFTNGGVEIGSSTSGVGAYGVGKDAVLYSMMEDGTGANANSGKQPIVKYQIGQEDGTVLKQWSTAPTWHINYPATGKDSYNYGNNAFAATEKGVWISQNKSNDADRPEIAFIDKDGVIQFMQNLNKSQGGGLAVNADNTVLYLQKAGEILEYTISWTGNKPTLTLANVYPVNLAHITTISLDYAGNLITCAGTQYGSNTDNNVMKLVAYTLPTNDNTCTVPAAKAKALKLGVRYNVEVTVNDPAMGTAIGAGEYVAGETATLEASPAAHHQFVNWTFADATTSTDNPLELVVNSDITVTAHFEPIQHTLIAPTNDENKGTVSGAGAYNYGTEVTLTATPKPGYKLLYWSDRSTENPRNITMTKNVALSAYFVKEYVVEPTFTIEKVWENTNVPASTNNGYQAVGWDGKIYMKDRLNAAINVYTELGAELYAQLGSTVAGLAGDQPIAVDEAGNLIVRSGSSYFYDSPTQISIFRKDETTPKVIDFTLPVTGRCDFISASGDIYSAKGGYVYFYCMSQTTINRVKIAEGELVSTEVVGIGLPSGQSQSHVMTNIFGNIIAHTKSNNIKEINVHTNQTLSLTLPSNKNTTLGGCSFELGGKELIAYNIAGTDYNSEWNIYNMTDKKFLSNETLYAKDKVSKKVSGAANWLNVQVVDENTAYIYQFCPEVAVAIWKVTMHEVVLRDTENNEDLLTDLNSNTTNVSVYRSLTGGMYNTLCLPFDVNELTGTPLENATIWQYNGATVKGNGTSKEIFLDFAEVTSIAAGEPYLVEPAEDIAAPMEFKDVTISVTNGNDVAQGAVTMHGILHPTKLQANNKSILFLVENNNLAWANETANMNGMRAYFQLTEAEESRPMQVSARISVDRGSTTEDIIVLLPTDSQETATKIMRNGIIYILRNGEIYTLQGTKLK